MNNKIDSPDNTSVDTGKLVSKNANINIQGKIEEVIPHAIDHFSVNGFNKKFYSSDDFEIHPLCTGDPEMGGAQLKAFFFDLLTYGQIIPVVLINIAGKLLILDGKNRYQALKKLGKEVLYIIIDTEDKDLPSFRRSLNKLRFHYTKSMLAAYAAEEKPELIKKNNEILKQKISDIRGGYQPTFTESTDTNKTLADRWGVSHEYIRKAETIKNKDSGLFRQVKQGEIELPKAFEKINGDPGEIDNPTGSNTKRAAEKIKELKAQCKSKIKREPTILENGLIQLLTKVNQPEEKATRLVTTELKREYNTHYDGKKSESKLLQEYIEELKTYYNINYDNKASKLFNKKLDNGKINKKDPNSEFNFKTRLTKLKNLLTPSELDVLEKIIKEHEEKQKNPVPEKRSINWKLKKFVRENYPYAIGDEAAQEIYTDIQKVSKLKELPTKTLMTEIVNQFKGVSNGSK